MKRFSMLMLVLFLVLQTFGFVVFAEEAAVETVNEGWNLTIIHTNDTHAHLENVAKRFTIVNGIRAEVENSILLDAGDVFSGTLFFTTFLGKADAKFMNLLGYDAMVPGNHEFDKGTEVFADFVKELQFPIVSSNIDYSTEPDLNGLFYDEIAESVEGNGGKIFPALILDVNGEKVGVFGLTTEETVELASPGPNLKFLDIVESSKNTIKMLEEQGINKIVAITHLGYTYDLQLAEAVEGIDIIIGGHSHTKIDAPLVVENAEPTLIVQANEFGKFVGVLDVTFNEEGTLTHWNGYLIDINEQDEEGNEIYAEDEEVAALLAEYEGPIEEMKKQVVGRTAVDLIGTRELVRTQETNLGNLITDSILAKTSELVGATIAFHNGGNIRESIEAGDITLGDVRTVQPFDNMMVALELSGAELVEALEHGVSEIETGHGRFPHVGGMKYTFDSRNPVGERIVSVEVKIDDGYVPIDLQASYKVATNSFLADGGDGYSVFKEAADDGRLENLFFVDYELFVEYLEKAGEVSPEVEGRMINLASVSEEEATAEDTVIEEPVVEEPVVEDPVVEQPVVEQPVQPALVKEDLVYVVKSGDVLWKIGRQFGIDWQVLAEYNKLKNPHLILIGQKLLIPAQ